jgi:hypothetical protein
MTSSTRTFACFAAALVATTGLLASAGTAEARGADPCLPWKCNGTQLDGIRIDGEPSSALAAAVTLPSGEIVRFGSDTGQQPRLRVAAKKQLRDKQKQFETLVRDNQVTSSEQQSLRRR